MNLKSRNKPNMLVILIQKQLRDTYTVLLLINAKDSVYIVENSKKMSLSTEDIFIHFPLFRWIFKISANCFIHLLFQNPRRSSSRINHEIKPSKDQ